MLRRHLRALVLVFASLTLPLVTSACGVPTTAERLGEANKKMEKGVYEGAIKITLEVLKDEPDNAIAQKMLIDAYLSSGDSKLLDEAIKKIDEFSAKASAEGKSFFVERRGKAMLTKIKEMRRDRTYANNEEGYEEMIINILPVTAGSERAEAIRYLSYLYDEQFERISEIQEGEEITEERVEKLNNFIKTLGDKVSLDADKGGKIKPFLTVPLIEDEFRKRMTKTSKRFVRKLREAKLAQLEEAKRIAREEKLKGFTDAQDATLKSDAFAKNPLLIITATRVGAYILIPISLNAEQVTQVQTLIKDIPSVEGQLNSLNNPGLLDSVRDAVAAEMFKILTTNVVTLTPGMVIPEDKALPGSVLETMTFDKFDFSDVPDAPGMKQPRIAASISRDELLNLTIEFDIAITQGITRDTDVKAIEAQGDGVTAPKNPAPGTPPAPKTP